MAATSLSREVRNAYERAMKSSFLGREERATELFEGAVAVARELLPADSLILASLLNSVYSKKVVRAERHQSNALETFTFTRAPGGGCTSTHDVGGPENATLLMTQACEHADECVSIVSGRLAANRLGTGLWCAYARSSGRLCVSRRVSLSKRTELS